MGGVKVNMTSSDQAKFRKDVKEYSRLMNVSSSAALDAFSLKVIDSAQRILRSNKTSNTGNLADSLSFDRTPLGGRKIGTNTGYGLYVEFGRPPGQMPDSRALLRWVRRKLGLRGKEAKQAAYNISRAIGERGTRAQPFLRPAFEREKRRLILELRKEIAKRS